MADLVTLAEAKEFCRISNDYEDAALATMIAAASDAVAEQADGWDGIGPVPPRLKIAVLARVAIMFDERDSVEAPKGEAGMLSPLRVLDL